MVGGAVVGATVVGVVVGGAVVGGCVVDTPPVVDEPALVEVVVLVDDGGRGRLPDGSALTPPCAGVPTTWTGSPLCTSVPK